ncbi:hypothetical protein LTR56_020360 [Elasticomyces elasticus]|nr:hypothetical protein LTR56_020360 [Elasticomyces elasticus]KAK3654715.1 hypothetical protein LTR22_010617 [Elasticomyces elasticus]KAK4910306.1 hypothetical protein LTR49_020987 [Elasticomyces elasticus]KAK5750037.1 hypothetical protein LTS12_019919 [Elasticomyces elasticus]
MKLTTSLVVAFSAVFQIVLGNSVSTYSQTGCLTRSTTKKPANIPTSTLAKTLSRTRKVTSVYTPTATVLPSSITLTQTVTFTASETITLLQISDTFTTTLTASETETSSSTLTLTNFATITANTVVTPAATAIATPAGFTPLASALAAAGVTYTKNKRSHAVPRRAIAAAREAEPESHVDARAVADLSGICKKHGPTFYPAAVSCYRFVQIVTISTVTSTAKTTKTVTGAPGVVSAHDLCHYDLDRGPNAIFYYRNGVNHDDVL